jgi:hypothetical protein
VKDRSLDEFVDGGDGSADAGGKSEPGGDGDDAPTEDASDPPAHADEGATGPDATGSDAAERALATSRWDPAGATCPACGETVERRWRADEDDPAASFVCAACKEW